MTKEELIPDHEKQHPEGEASPPPPFRLFQEEIPSRWALEAWSLLRLMLWRREPAAEVASVVVVVVVEAAAAARLRACSSSSLSSIFTSILLGCLLSISLRLVAHSVLSRGTQKWFQGKLGKKMLFHTSNYNLLPKLSLFNP